MMHPLLAAGVANSLFADRSAPARPRSVKRGAATSGRRPEAAAFRRAFSADAADVVIRRAAGADAPALRRLGVLDSNRRAGEALANTGAEVLVAEVDGSIQAALSLDGAHAVADPFRATALHAQLLELRARQLGADVPERHGRLVLAPRTS